MLMGAVAWQPPALEFVPVQSNAVVTVNSPEIVSLVATKKFGYVISVASPQAITLTPAPTATPSIGAGGFGTTSRILQPGNLQTGQLLRVNWDHPLASGLVYLEIFDQIRPNATDYPFMTPVIGNHGTLTLSNVTTRGGPGGHGITLSSVTSNFQGSSNTVAVPQTKGSYFAYVTAQFAPNDNQAHYVTVIGNEAGNSFFSLLKFTDNNTYFGWVTSNVGYRAVVASTGLWSSGETFMYGGTWNTSNVHCFIKGKLAGSLGAGPTTNNTATGVYRLGNSSAGNNTWGSTVGRNYIYYVAMWNRDLSTAECNYLHQNPYCFMTAGAPRP